jgi:hypothetical protein
MQTQQSQPSAFALLMLSLLGAALAAAANITMIWLEAQSSPHDVARGEPLWTVLLNPFVITFGAPIAFFSGLLVFLLLYYWLRDTVAWKTISLIYIMVIGEIVIVGRHDPISAWFASYATILVAAGLSKLLFKIRHPISKNASS